MNSGGDKSASVLSCRQQAKPLIHSRLSAIVGITPETPIAPAISDFRTLGFQSPYRHFITHRFIDQ
jgi:hypothetical protein